MNGPLSPPKQDGAAKARGRQRSVRFLSQPLPLEEAGPPRLLR